MSDNETHGWMEPDNDEEAAIRHLTENTDLSPNQARELVAQNGTDLGDLMKIAATMKAEG